ncbi:uncharacterized protein LOC127725306 [Mytilus californianus]|uniref:uncharacterized protein LOC127725306 n=1 Tax=Mytilus californianus TaxID=6549 RepID=UPI0022475BDE|nr:uncharacterized protein LOC127725306 [Mytilus californianus]
MAIFKMDEWIILTTDGEARFNIDREHNVLTINRKSNPSYAMKLSDAKDIFSFLNNYIPRVRKLTYGKNSLKYTAAVLWNDLPDEFRGIANFSQLQKLLKSWNGNDDYGKSLFIDNSANNNRAMNSVSLKQAVNHEIGIIRLDFLKYQNSVQPKFYHITATLPDKIEKGRSDNVTMADANLLELPRNKHADVNNKGSLFQKRSIKVPILSEDQPQNYVNSIAAVLYQKITETSTIVIMADAYGLKISGIPHVFSNNKEVCISV